MCIIRIILYFVLIQVVLSPRIIRSTVGVLRADSGVQQSTTGGARRRTDLRMAAITPLNATPPLDATLAAVTEVQRPDVEAMHE